ncbi:hypothetical protein [Catenovulum adriaticum]|uniref:Transglutaminase superfamily protein n=1 Tax=Catenovulum adriaticum TaxID=2984846 RepID=A0ABY7AL61_9ALTE|nr:hypothetical protein [Catenovulum sp. TS8]WAJ70007.1 hypothetical protein OLW01_12800 [Catenovulum sp. TS8]
MNKIKLIIFAILISITSQLVSAKQIQFSRQQNQFNYQWLDHNKTQQSLSFSVKKPALFNLLGNFKAYRPALAQQYLFIQLQRQLPDLNSRHAQLRLYRQGKDVAIKIKSTSPAHQAQIMENLNQLKASLLKAYLQKHYYMEFTNSSATTMIKPDHIRIAQTAQPLFTELNKKAEVQLKKMNIKQFINFYLGWLQSIPYSTLEDRVTSQGAGFNPPNRLLLENQGDCDSKSTLFISLMRNFFARLEMVMVYLPNHALVGLKMPYQAKDEFINIDGINYVLAEPTGPALMKLGQISDSSKRHIQANRFTVETMPIN